MLARITAVVATVITLTMISAGSSVADAQNRFARAQLKRGSRAPSSAAAVIGSRAASTTRHQNPFSREAILAARASAARSAAEDRTTVAAAASIASSSPKESVARISSPSERQETAVAVPAARPSAAASTSSGSGTPGPRVVVASSWGSRRTGVIQSKTPARTASASTASARDAARPGASEFVAGSRRVDTVGHINIWDVHRWSGFRHTFVWKGYSRNPYFVLDLNSYRGRSGDQDSCRRRAAERARPSRED